VLMLEEQAKVQPAPQADVYFVMVGENTVKTGQKLAEQLRDALPDLRISVHSGGGSFKSQLKKADKSGAVIALILGESELQKSTINIKFLRQEKPQLELEQAQLLDKISAIINE